VPRSARLLQLAATVAALLLVAGCANRPINPPLEQVEPDRGYRPALLLKQRENNDPTTLFVLSFSGGGTRAAALSYGVLEELRRTEYVADTGETRRLIDEVDVITGVSGGSFTALSYALYGDRLFEEYEQRFLKRNVQGALSRRFFLNPNNWFRLMSGNFGRSEIAAEYYDEILFEGATFNDLLDRQGPAAIASGTDITFGARFAFYQEDFDLLCSDLGPITLSRAAATSSAVPTVLSPVTLNNYAGGCGYRYPAWVDDILKLDQHLRPAGRSLERYRNMEMFRDSAERPYIHLVDGGVSDNIGVRGVLEAFEEMNISRDFSESRDFDRIRRIFMIVVNAHSDHQKDWEKNASPPGTIKQLVQSSGVPIERYSFETVELMKDRAEVADMRRRLQIAEAQLDGATLAEAEAMYPRHDFYVMDVSFDKVRDPADRAYFMSLPTSFVLEPEAVDRLVGIAGELMRQAPVYRDILATIGARRAD
jgi:NTE family protein